MQLEPPRGMRDFYPEDLPLRERIFAAWTAAASLHGFLRYEAPVVENFDLLARKAGEEVSRQIYHFKDKSDRDLALRPEVTPSLVRMIAARQQDVLFPAKWWTIGQCFRYERMTRGRKREHFQWNLDIIGERSVLAEAWILSCATHALRALGLGPGKVRIHINHRQLVASLLSECGVPQEKHLDVFMVLDKKDKVPVETLKGMLAETRIDAKAVDAVAGLGAREVDDVLSGPLGGSPAGEEVRRLLDLADALGFGDLSLFDSGIVRGLSYYTGTVFECFDAGKKFRAIFGGGRYDNLFRDMTGVGRPAVGMGFGDVVIGEVLSEQEGSAPARPRVQVCVGMFDASLSRTAAEIAARLVAAGIETDLAFPGGKPGKFFGYADRRGALFTVFLAPDELRQNAAMVKEMSSGDQTLVALKALPGWLNARLGGEPGCGSPPAG